MAGRTPSSRFNVVSTTPSASLGGPCGPPPRHLGALATNIGEILRLARRGERASLPPEFNIRRLGCRGLGALGCRHASVHGRAGAGDSPDEIWLVEHPPVYTLGLAGRREHVHAPGRIPVVTTDRGGQGDLSRTRPGRRPTSSSTFAVSDAGVRGFVHGLEQAVIDGVGRAGVVAARRPGAPGSLRERREARRPRPQGAAGLHLSRGRGQRRPRPRPLSRQSTRAATRVWKVTRLHDLGVDWSVRETGGARPHGR